MDKGAIGHGRSNMRFNAVALLGVLALAASTATAAVSSYVVGYGDTLSDIALQFYGDAEYWDEILAALSPAERDFFPAKWEQMARLHIETKGGGKWWVALYRLDDSVGAFSSGPTVEARRYYRGGNSKLLEEALEKALAESEKPKGQPTKPAEE